jgi:hypothetical protein
MISFTLNVDNRVTSNKMANIAKYIVDTPDCAKMKHCIKFKIRNSLLFRLKSKDIKKKRNAE